MNAQNISTTKDIFSIVYIGKGDYAPVYTNINDFSSLITKIPSSTINIKTTWKTSTTSSSWLEVIYKGKTGWVERQYLTKNNGLLKTQYASINELLFNLTKSIQSKNFNKFQLVIHKIRGLATCNNKIRKLTIYKYNNLKELFNIINEEKNDSSINKWEYNLFKNLLMLLESEFDIEYDSDSSKIPLELKNFQFIKIYNNTKLKSSSLLLGIEFWNNNSFISCIINNEVP